MGPSLFRFTFYSQFTFKLATKKQMTSNVLASSEASKTSEMSSKEVLSNPLSKKLNKILETRLDNDKVKICF